MKDAKKLLKVRERNSLLQICIPTSGCRLGRCIFCNYGKSELLPLNDILIYIKSVLDEYRTKSKVLINAIGSVLDNNEVPKEYLFKILRLINEYDNVKVVILETHYLTINDIICSEIRKIFKDKEVSIEVGVETSNIQSMKYIHKHINFDLLKEKIEIMHKYNFDTEGNVFVGIPFLSIEDRVKDAVRTIYDTLAIGMNQVVLFPCNLRNDTELKKLYDNGKYKKVSHFEILDCLNQLNEDTLYRVSFSWYGDWIQTNDDNDIVNEFPLLTTKHISLKEEQELKELWMNFYNDFIISANRKDTLVKYNQILSKYK